jgi:hypothetical protein
MTNRTTVRIERTPPTPVCPRFESFETLPTLYGLPVYDWKVEQGKVAIMDAPSRGGTFLSGSDNTAGCSSDPELGGLEDSEQDPSLFGCPRNPPNTGIEWTE